MTLQTVKVDYTSYEVTITRNGKEAVLVIYHLKPFGEVKEWLFPGPKLDAWWVTRAKIARPYDLKEVVRLCNVGKVLPTDEVTFKREGMWPTVVSTKTKPWSEGVVRFMKEIREIDPDCEVVMVIA